VGGTSLPDKQFSVGNALALMIKSANLICAQFNRGGLSSDFGLLYSVLKQCN
jgi:hypothetical protein